jgi:hypothetical protein
MPVHGAQHAAAVAILFLCLFAGKAFAIDGFSTAIGSGAFNTQADIVRVDVVWDWDGQWFTGGDWYLTGYWEANLGYLDSNQTGNDRFVETGFAGLLRYQSYLSIDLALRLYLDAGIGIHLLTKTKIGNSNLSTSVQFSPSAGAGAIFGSRGQYELGYRYLHLSNGSIKKPNPGLDFHMLRFVYRFRRSL